MNKKHELPPLSGEVCCTDMRRPVAKVEVNYVSGTVCEPVLMILALRWPLSIH